MITVKTKGFKELEDALGKIEKEATRKNIAIRSLTKAGDMMVMTAQRMAPTDEGDLRSAITIAPRATTSGGRKGKRGGSGGQFGDVVRVFMGIDLSVNNRLIIYSAVQEWGNVSNPAQPYMRPAFDAEKFRYVDRLSEELSIDIGKAIGRQERKRAKAL